MPALLFRRHYGHFFPVLYTSKYLAGHCQPREPQAFSQPHPTFCRALFALIDLFESSILNIAQVRGEEFSLLREATHVVCDSTHALDPAAAMSGIPTLLQPTTSSPNLHVPYRNFLVAESVL